MNYLDIVARYVHVLAVITLVGSQAYSSTLLSGMVQRLAPEEASKLYLGLLRGQPAFVWGHLAAIVASGLVLAGLRLSTILTFGPYGTILLVKLLLVAVLLAIAALNSFSVVPRLMRLMVLGSNDPQVLDQIRYLARLSNRLVRFNVAVAAAIVLLAVALTTL